MLKMILIDKNQTLKFLGAPEAEELEKWCRYNNYSDMDLSIEMDGMPSDRVLASALWYAQIRYPKADVKDIYSFAGLVAYLATGWYGGFGTEDYEPEQQAQNIVIAWAGGVAPSPEGDFGFMPKNVIEEGTSLEFTITVLSFLEAFYFADDKERAVSDILTQVDERTAAKVILGLATSEKQHQDILGMFRRGQVLTPSMVAKEYGITPRNVTLACKCGNLSEDEAVQTPGGRWIITRSGAERLWGKRKK